MRVLLLSMPDTADVIDYVIRLPNLGIVSLAGSLTDHEVKVLDLVLCKQRIRRTLERLLVSFRPQVIGLSSMTFQFDTLLRVSRFIRQVDPTIKLVAGGYHASLLAFDETSGMEEIPLDFLVRGEGELTFKKLIAELAGPSPNFSHIQGLSYRQESTWRHNPDRPLLDLSVLPLPQRQARLAQGFYFLNMPMDVAETSRGCTHNCKFCSITQMYGRTFRRFPLNRIIKDLTLIRKSGGKAVFFIDDNITYDINHFRQVCQAIVRHKLHDLCYMAQVSAVGIAKNPELVADMDRANFRIIFVGFESMDQSCLNNMNKPANPEINQRAATLLRQYHMGIIAGCIFGYPNDRADTISHNFRLIKQLRPDMIYCQYLTPYLKTVVRQELLDAKLVANPDDYRFYDGFNCNIRTRYLSQKTLYRRLKIEALKRHLDFSLLRDSYFIRHHPLSSLIAWPKSFLTTLYNVVRGRQWTLTLDI